MKILFLQNFWHEHIGTMCLAGVLKSRGHSAAVAIGKNFENLKDRIRDYSPDILCFSCTTGEHLWALDVASKAKKMIGAPVIFGGPHPTYMPDIIENENVDFVCVGEGEGAMQDLIDALDKGGDPSGVPNIISKTKNGIVRNGVRHLIENLDLMPAPDRSIYYDNYKFINDNPVKHFMAGRGCLFECSYCYNHSWKELYRNKGHVLRYHSPSYCIGEILDVKKRYPIKTVVFEDDTFTGNRMWLTEFLEMYNKKVRIPFACNVHASTVTDETARLLGESGCFRVNMGVESGSEELRRMLLNKKISDAEIVDSARRLHRHGIKVLTNNMLGLPGETLEDAFKTVKLNIKIKTDYPWCSILQPYPNTRIEECAKKYSKKNDCGGKKFQNTFFEDTVLDQPDMEKIVNLQKLFYIAVKMPALFPVVKQLIRLPLRKLYNALFLMTFAYRYMRCHRMSPVEMMIFSIRNSRLYGKSLQP